MKNLFLIVSLFIVVFAYSQDKSYTFSINKTTKSVETYMPVEAISFFNYDSISKYDSSFTVKILTNQDGGFKYEMKIKADSTAGTPTAKFILSEKTFDDETLTAIDTIDWAGSSSDTTMYFSSTSSFTYSRQLWITIDADISSDTTQNFKLEELELKLYKE